MAASNKVDKVVIASRAQETFAYWDIDKGCLFSSCISPAALSADHNLTATSLLLSKDGNQALVAGSDGVVYHWDLKRQTCLACLQSSIQNSIVSIAVSDEFNTLFTASPHQIEVWDLKTHQTIGKLSEPWLSTPYIACDENGRYILTGGGTKIQLWECDWALDINARTHHDTADTDSLEETKPPSLFKRLRKIFKPKP